MIAESESTEGARGLTLREQRDRSRSRAWALQVHYRWEAGACEQPLVEVLAETTETRRIAARRLPYVRRLLETLDRHLQEVDKALQREIENWRFDRLASIDRGILRLAAVELEFFDDVPPKSSILEAVRLAESYGGHESPRFVNGVLDALYKRGR